MIIHKKCGGTHETADETRACHFGESAPTADPVRAAIAERAERVDPASPKQVAFLRSLLEDRDIESLNGNDYERAFDLSTNAEKFIGKGEASSLIDALLNAPKVEGEQVGDPDEGIYFVEGTYFKVQVAVHGSGRKYAKRFDNETGEWVYDGRGSFGSLTESTRVTPEKAAEFGHLYGMCVRCGRTLTDEDSIAAGIGPICAGKI